MAEANGGGEANSLAESKSHSSSGATIASTIVNKATSVLNDVQLRFVATNNGAVGTTNGATLTVAQVFFLFPIALMVERTVNLYLADAKAEGRW